MFYFKKSISEAFREDNKIIFKNLQYIKTRLVDLDENSRAELSKFTKGLGNRLLNSYEKYSKCINDQRCENLRLQCEINNLVKEKNSLNHDAKNLDNAIKKIEKFLGVDTLNIDCNEKNKKIENAIFDEKTKPYHNIK